MYNRSIAYHIRNDPSDGQFDTEDGSIPEPVHGGAAWALGEEAAEGAENYIRKGSRGNSRRRRGW